MPRLPIVLASSRWGARGFVGGLRVGPGSVRSRRVAARSGLAFGRRGGGVGRRPGRRHFRLASLGVSGLGQGAASFATFPPNCSFEPTAEPVRGQNHASAAAAAQLRC